MRMRLQIYRLQMQTATNGDGYLGRYGGRNRAARPLQAGSLCMPAAVSAGLQQACSRLAFGRRLVLSCFVSSRLVSSARSVAESESAKSAVS